jgi:diacylglycerol kinase family enzyme
MKFAVVISVGRGPESLTRAVKTQRLLLDLMGERLESVRLAAPHLFEFACIGAVTDRPDLFVIAGGPRAARLAGQIAHRHGVPILFLPGARAYDWGRRLWGSLSLDDMIAALAREDIRPTRLGAGFAGGEIFLGDARLGFLPQLANLNETFRETEMAMEGWSVFSRAVSLGRTIAGGRPEMHCPERDSMRVATLIVTAQGFDGSPSRNLAMQRPQNFSCSIWKYANPIAYTFAALKALAGGDWRKRADADCFECNELSIDMHSARWIVLDGEPVWSQKRVVLRFQPDAVRVFSFRQEQKGIDSNQSRTTLRHPAMNTEKKGTTGRRTAFSYRTPAEAGKRK